MPTAELVKEATYYVPTFFIDDKPWARNPGECTLVVKHFRQTRGKTGKLYLHGKSEGLRFPDEEAMVQAIEEGGWKEFDAEVDGQLSTYVPEEFRS